MTAQMCAEQDSPNGHAKVEKEKLLRPPHLTKNYRQLRKAGNVRDGLSQGRTQQVAV